MIGSQVTKIASAMNIPPEHLKWYAAFTTRDTILMCISWCTRPTRAKDSSTNTESRRYALRWQRDIFAQDLQSIYEDRTEIRQKLKEAANKLIREILSRAENCSYSVQGIGGSV